MARRTSRRLRRALNGERSAAGSDANELGGDEGDLTREFHEQDDRKQMLAEQAGMAAGAVEVDESADDLLERERMRKPAGRVRQRCRYSRSGH